MKREMTPDVDGVETATSKKDRRVHRATGDDDDLGFHFEANTRLARDPVEEATTHATSTASGNVDALDERVGENPSAESYRLGKEGDVDAHLRPVRAADDAT